MSSLFPILLEAGQNDTFGPVVPWGIFPAAWVPV